MSEETKKVLAELEAALGHHREALDQSKRARVNRCTPRPQLTLIQGGRDA